MPAEINLALVRFPHVESILNTSMALSDGATLNVHEFQHDVSLEDSRNYESWELPSVRHIAAREVRALDVSAIPVFTTRRFVQWMVEVSEGSDIQEPRDLEGKRLVLHNYGNTDTIWSRGVLQESYGVDLSGISWVTLHQEMLPELAVPDGVELFEGADRDQLLRDGLVDAALTSGHPYPPAPGVRYLWPDPDAAAAAWYPSAHFIPMLHVVVIKNAALAEHPSLARDLYEVFDRAKTAALEKWNYGATLSEDRHIKARWSGFPVGAEREFLGRDPIPYGFHVPENRDAFERLIRYSHDLGATQQMHSLEELFVSVA